MTYNKPTESQKQNLIQWYQAHFRALPWRKTKDPYQIWISETMLQQTTTQAVVPYFERFMQQFPTLQDLANSHLDQVLENWSGLGYYSRARNLHKAAKALKALKKFPSRYEELIEFPGLGPYTARAVASLAFEQNVGVLDGNVIRILCRIHGLKWEWWKTKERQALQKLSDLWVTGHSSSVMNQAMMELGATICAPKSPSCLLCPLKQSCRSQKLDLVPQIPLSKTRKAKEIWLWTPQLRLRSNQIFLSEKHELPFLKSQPMPGGKIQKVAKKPTKFDFRHSITHYDIYVHVDSKPTPVEALKGKWVPLNELSKTNPSSLLRKLVETHQLRSRRHSPAGSAVYK